MNRIKVGGALAVVALLCSSAGCDSPVTPALDGGRRTDSGMMGSDGGRDGGTDPCVGVTQCAAIGTSCDGDTLVTCAADMRGCRIAMRMDCTATAGGTCEMGATGATCEVDPCAAIPVDMRCDTVGRACTGDTLDVCIMDAAGCLVRSVTDCAASPGGRCTEASGTPDCALPPDPCAAIPAGDRCDTAGTSCTGTSLETCAPDAFGCLVRSTTDCASRPGGACGGTPAACTATDPCAGITECATAGTACDGPELVTCAADAFGCMVETRADCTDTMFGFCDTAGSPPACSTAAVDPCMGMTLCTPEGRTCDMNTLRACTRNAFGCLVDMPTDCASTGDVCDTTSGTAMCVDPCSLVTLCPSATYCDATGELVTCADDMNGCLVETSRMACAGGTTCGGDPAACADVCPSASPMVLDCDSSMVMGDTTGMMGVRGSYAGCTTSTSYATGTEQIFRFRNPVNAAVTIASAAGMAPAGVGGDFDLFALDAGEDRLECGDPAIPCVRGSRAGGSTESITFNARPDRSYYVVFDGFGGGTTPGTFGLTISCVEPTCGDGTVGAAEGCDDMNTTNGDGCSDICQLETGYVCTGAPSTCMIACGNGTIDAVAGETCDDMNMTAGDGCSATCRVETGFLCTGTPSVCARHCGNGVVNASVGETCDDMNTMGGDGCSATCGVEAGFVCTGAPSTCVMACGNGTLEAPDEQCEDGNTAAGDGCAMCRFESGSYCTGLPSVCAASVCGNSTVDGGESCDAGDTMSGDGCSSNCAIEIAASGSSVTLMGTLEASDGTYTRTGSTCGARTGAPGAFDTYVIENTTMTAQTLTITATWPSGGDGYLFAYRFPFNPAVQRFNCVIGNDDFGGTGGSRLTGVTIAPGQRLVIVATEFLPGDALGAHSIVVATN